LGAPFLNDKCVVKFRPRKSRCWPANGLGTRRRL
jgi:hypothetical protein